MISGEYRSRFLLFEMKVRDRDALQNESEPEKPIYLFPCQHNIISSQSLLCNEWEE